MERENAIEEIYSRRVGITKDGVVFKQLRTKPVTYDPMDPGAECCCNFGRFKEEEHQSTTKVIPPAQVQDIKVEEPAGGTRQIVNCCGCVPQEVGELIEDVDSKVYISTAGDIGAELVVYGLINGPHLRDTVIALKNGKPMPPPAEGVEDTGSMEMSFMNAAPGVAPSGISSSERDCGFAAPSSIMVPPGSNDESVALLRSIDGKLSQLVSIAQAHA